MTVRLNFVSGQCFWWLTQQTEKNRKQKKKKKKHLERRLLGTKLPSRRR